MDLPVEQLGVFLDTLPDAMLIVDPLGNVAFVNARAEEMFAYARSDLVGRPLEALVPERFRDRHAAHQSGYLGSPRPRPMGAGLELYARRKDGSEFPVEVSLSPLQTAAGTFVASAIRDVTYRKAVEEQLVAARDVAERASREKTALLAAASHDLRQPLQTLALLSGVLGSILPRGTEAASAVATQSATLRWMMELLNSLLDLSGLDGGRALEPEIRECSLRTVSSRLVDTFGAQAAAKGLELIVDEQDYVVRTDPALLGRILQNLVANAIRYTPAGSVRVRAVGSGATVRIEVSDTGVGIAADELGRVFDEFYQGPHAAGHHGLGLGLAIVRRLATALSCPVEVTSRVGRGSCFAINVPKSVRASAGLGSHERPVLRPLESCAVYRVESTPS
jgi:PAS domain S-box-containing protein